MERVKRDEPFEIGPPLLNLAGKICHMDLLARSHVCDLIQENTNSFSE